MFPLPDRDTQMLIDTILDRLGRHPWTGKSSFSHIRTIGPTRLVFRMGCWTSSVMWQDSAIIEIAATAIQMGNRENYPAIATALTGRLIDIQERRHLIATAHGLKCEAGTALDPASLGVDRVTALLLAKMDVDPANLVQEHRLRAATLTDGEHPHSIEYYVAPTCRLTVTISDSDPAPVLSCKMPLSSAWPKALIDGNILSVAARIPEPLLDAAAGRRVGEVVETGISILDERLITGTASTDEGVDITFEAGLITIGEARRDAVGNG